MQTVRCRDCGRSFEIDEPGDTFCPYCGRACAGPPTKAPAPAPADAELPDDAVPVARAANLAEAGYFQSVLEPHQIPAYIDTRHAAASSDECPVVLLVPAGYADRAVEILQTASTRDGDDPDADVAHEEEEHDDDSDRAGRWSWWAPVLVAAAFVIAGILLLRSISAPPPPKGRAPRPPASGGAQ